MILKIWVIEKYLTDSILGEFQLTGVELGIIPQYFLILKGSTNEILELKRLENRNFHFGYLSSR